MIKRITITLIFIILFLLLQTDLVFDIIPKVNLYNRRIHYGS